MKKTLALALFAVVILEYALFFSAAQAQVQPQNPNINNTSLFHLPYIRLYDEQGNQRTEFFQNEKVRIVTYFPSPIYIVRVIDPDGETVFSKMVVAHECAPYGVYDSGLLTGLTDKNGEWHVEAGILCWFKVKPFFVVPYTPLGILGIFAACFTGFSLQYAKTRRNHS